MARVTEQRIFEGQAGETRPTPRADEHGYVSAGDIYRELDTGQEYHWTGTQWEFRASNLAPLLTKVVSLLEEILNEVRKTRLGHELALWGEEIHIS